MPSTQPYTPTFDFATDAAPADLVNSAALQTQLQAISANIADFLTAAGLVITDSDDLANGIVRIVNLHPELATYIQSAISGSIATQALTFKYPARVAKATDQTLFGLPVVDGIQLVEGDRVMLVGQTNPVENGLWVAHNPATPVFLGVWSRPTDLPAAGTVGSGWAVIIRQGTALGSTVWMPIAGGTPLPVVGTDNLTFFQLFGPFPVTVAHGGTGSSTAAGARSNLAAPGKFVATITGDGVTTTFSVNHALGTASIFATVLDATGNVVQVDLQALNTTHVVVVFATAPVNAATFTVVVMG
jgi:hypothetical protein